MVKEPGFSTFFSLFASGHLRRDQVKSLLLLIQDDDSGSLEDDFPDFDNGPTLSWALKQDWTFSNLTSFHLNVLYCAVDDANFKLIQQLLLQIPQVQILRVYGDSEFNEAIHIWSSQLELSMILQNSKLRKIWLQGLHITVDVPAAAVLTNLALVGCKLTYDDLAMLLFSSTKSLEHLHLEGIRGAGLSWASIERALQPNSETLQHLFLVDDSAGDGRLFAGADKLRLSELPFLRACTALEVLYLPAFYDITKLAQYWPNLKLAISGDYSEKSKSFVKQALRTSAINISYILDQDYCEQCYYPEDFEVQPACEWVPSRVGALYLTCKDCDRWGRMPWSDAIFYSRPFPANIMPPAYCAE